MNSGLKVMPKGLRRSILSKIMVRMLTFRDRTTDVTYCPDVMLFFCTRRQADYHRLWHFLCADFLRFIALNAIWPLTNIMPPKHAEQDQIDAKWLGKKVSFLT